MAWRRQMVALGPKTPRGSVASFDATVAVWDAKFHHWTARPNQFDSTLTTTCPPTRSPTIRRDTPPRSAALPRSELSLLARPALLPVARRGNAASRVWAGVPLSPRGRDRRRRGARRAPPWLRAPDRRRRLFSSTGAMSWQYRDASTASYLVPITLLMLVRQPPVDEKFGFRARPIGSFHSTPIIGTALLPGSHAGAGERSGSAAPSRMVHSVLR